MSSVHPFDVYRPGDTVGVEKVDSHLIYHLRQRGLTVFKAGYGVWEICKQDPLPKRAQAYFEKRRLLVRVTEQILDGEAPLDADPAQLKRELFFEDDPELIRLVNIKAFPGAPYDLYIGRANAALGLAESKWHNPFHLKREADRPAVLAQYRAHVLARPDLLAALPELKGLRLGCFCYPKPCHGGVLIDLYNELVKP